MFCSAQLDVASRPEIVKTEHGKLVRLGSAASHAKYPEPELTTIMPPFPTFGIYIELLIKLSYIMMLKL